MLSVRIPGAEWFDDRTQTFEKTKTWELQLEHSLVSVAKWEAKWGKPFLSHEQKTQEQCADYIRCMTITPNVDPKVYEIIPAEVYTEVNKYIDAPMTATWFNDKGRGPKNREVITSEIIYYWMISLGIPFECQKWHLNRLITLIRVCNVKSEPGKKMARKDLFAQNRSLNALRRQRFGTKG